MNINELLETKQIFNEDEAYEITADIENEMNQCKEMFDSTLHDYRLMLQDKLPDPANFGVQDVEQALFTRLEDASCGIQVIKNYIEDIENRIERKVNRGN
tara:strand:+ start:1278 stop:1577 length:300 start_codon:yes stop_codon:yes gene_type:complete